MRFRRVSILAILLAAPGLLIAGSNTWTGGQRGLAPPAVRVMAADPSNPQVVYAAFQSDLYRSGDGGRTWARIFNFGAPRPDRFLSLFVSPTSPATLLAGLVTALFRSTDGGASWSTSLDAGITALAGRPSDPAMLFAGSTGGLVFRSPDQGGQWTQTANLGGGTYAIAALLFDRRDGGALYAAGGQEVDYDYDYGIPSRLILQKSSDAGLTWTDLGASLPRFSFARAVTSGVASKELFASLSNADPNQRVLHSTDGGASWGSRGGGLADGVEVSRFIVDPRRPGTLYAASNAGLLRSTDGGSTFLPFGQLLRNQDISSLLLSGRTLHAGGYFGVFDLDLREGAVDVSAGPNGTRLLFWDADRLRVRTYLLSGEPALTPAEGPFGAWTAIAISDGADGKSRVLWVNGDGRSGLEVLDPSAPGSQSAFRFAAQPELASAADISVGVEGNAHILWTRPNGSAFLSSVDAFGALTVGPDYGPFSNWSALAVADGPDGATWVLWRAADGRSSVTRHRAFELETVFRFAASPGWAAEDLTVGADGRPRLLRVHPDGGAEVATVSEDGRPVEARVHRNEASSPRRIAAGPDGLTRILWGDAHDQTTAWLLRSDNTLAFPMPVPPTPTPTPTPTPIRTPGPNIGDLNGTWTGSFRRSGLVEQIRATVRSDGYHVTLSFNSRGSWEFRGILIGRLFGTLYCCLPLDAQGVGSLEGEVSARSISLDGDGYHIAVTR